jgi:fructokinase
MAGLYFAGIEAGGTKFVCAIGNSLGEVLERTSFPTTTPEETLDKCKSFFQEMYGVYHFVAIGVACFGPLDPDPASPNYGSITATPKNGWVNFNIVKNLRETFDMPIGFDTDVNGAAIGEARWGSGQGFDSLAYWTVGTGIGAGGILSGQLMHGLIHPEMGHIYVPHDKNEDPFPGICPYHKNCLEGLATGPAMMQRWQVEAATDLPADHPAWDLEAKYLAYAMANCIMMLSPKRIILGGGVMNKKELYGKVRVKTRELLNDYIIHRSILDDIDNFIVAPGLGNNAGVCGAFALAEHSYINRR